MISRRAMLLAFVVTSTLFAACDDTPPVDSRIVGDSALANRDVGDTTPFCSDPTPTTTPDPKASFFVTSEGNSLGGNYGGLDGADAKCQTLAQAAGLGGKTWHAYLSTYAHAGWPGETINAADRIGNGPWYDVAGKLVAEDVGSLRDDPARWQILGLTEKGELVAAGERFIFTGTQADGSAEPFPEDDDNYDAPPTCANWTSSAYTDLAWVGEVDWDCPAAEVPVWNSAESVSCDPQSLATLGSSGRLYCFAVS